VPITEEIMSNSEKRRPHRNGNPGLALALVLALAFMPAGPVRGENGEVANGGANLREHPTMKSRVLETIPAGTQVQILERQVGEWFKVLFDGDVGFVHGSRLWLGKAGAGPVPLPLPLPLPPSSPRTIYDGDVLRQQATVAFYQKNWSEVARVLGMLSPEHSTFSDHFLLGAACKEVQQYEKAAQAFQRAIECQGQVVNYATFEAFKQLGEIHLKTQNWQAAADLYKRVLERAPALEWALLGKGDANLFTGKYKEAIDDYTRALLCNPSFYEGYYKLGRAYFHSGNPQMAANFYYQAIIRQTNCEEAYCGLADVYLKLGRTEDALKTLKNAVAMFPSFRRAKARLEEVGEQNQVQDRLKILRHEVLALQEKINISRVLLLTGTMVRKFERNLYEIKLQSGDHAFLRTRRPLPATAGRFTLYVLRGRDGQIRVPSRNEAQKRVECFTEAPRDEELEIQNLHLELEEKKAALREAEDRLAQGQKSAPAQG